MSNDSDWPEQHGAVDASAAAAGGDGGIPLDAFWALLDPPERAAAEV